MAAARPVPSRLLAGDRRPVRSPRQVRVWAIEVTLRSVLVGVWITAMWLAAAPATPLRVALTLGAGLLYLPVTALVARRADVAHWTVARTLATGVDVCVGAAGAYLVPEWRVPVLFLYLVVVVTTSISTGGRRGLGVALLATTAATVLALVGGDRDTVTIVAVVPFAVCAFALPVLVSHLVSEHRRHAEHLSRLHTALASIATTPDLAGTVESITAAARDAVGATSVAVLTVDDDGAALTARPVPRGGDATGADAAATVSVPLRTGETVIGTLDASWAAGHGRPSRQDVDLLTAYAEGASLSILRAQAYEQERRAAVALRAAERDRAEFTASVAHELRTPLTTVRGFIETVLLREDDLSPGDQRHMLGIAHRNTVELTHRIAALLEHSKLEGDHVRIHPRVQPLAPAMARALDNSSGLVAPERLVVDIPTELLVELDEVALDHIVANLVGNAVKYSADGTPITIRAVVAGDEVVVSIADAGIGIPAAELPRIFDRFYRGGRQDGRAGSGIGLAIVRRYVELSGGRVWVESNEGVGSVFSFSLPYAGTAAGLGPVASPPVVLDLTPNGSAG